MIEFFRQQMSFFRYLGLILADKGKFGGRKYGLFFDYFKLVILNLYKGQNLREVVFLGHKLYFFDLYSTTRLIESIFIENEYYFETDSTQPIIYDLGSNIGLSVIYFKMLFPGSTIYAFEADPQTSLFLKKNVKSFGLDKITIYNTAITAKTGTIFFYREKEPGSPLMSTNPLRISTKKIKINSSKLSSYINREIDFVKMDIEGSEMEVLKDLKVQRKLSLIKQMSVEYHHHIDKTENQFGRFLQILENNHFGYQIHASQNTPFPLATFEDIQVHSYRQ